jgi:hypothetical protein
VNTTLSLYAVSKRVVEFVGVKRLREALETTDWETDDTLGFDELDGTEDDPESGSPAEFDIELTEMNRELLQLKTSLGDGSDVEDDDDVQESKLENLTSMMASLQAIRGTMFPRSKALLILCRNRSFDAGTTEKSLCGAGCE